MHALTPKRIAWYLHLQHVLRLPKYSLAPRSLTTRSQVRSPDNHSEERFKQIAKTSGGEFRSMLHRSAGTPAPLTAVPAAHSGNRLHQPTYLPGRTAIQGSSTPRAKSHLSLSQPRGSVTSQKHDKQVTLPGIHNASFLQAREHKKLGVTPAIEPTASRARPTDRHGPQSLSLTQSKKTAAATLPGFTQPKATTGRRFQVHPPISAPQVDAEFRRASNLTVQSPMPSGSAGSDSVQPKVATASTLHLDGSALGRWALQHLERSLGGPTTGMTGIDPRASLPRSRIAPF